MESPAAARGRVVEKIVELQDRPEEEGVEPVERVDPVIVSAAFAAQQSIKVKLVFDLRLEVRVVFAAAASAGGGGALLGRTLDEQPRQCAELDGLVRQQREAIERVAARAGVVASIHQHRRLAARWRRRRDWSDDDAVGVQAQPSVVAAPGDAGRLVRERVALRGGGGRLGAAARLRAVACMMMACVLHVSPVASNGINRSRRCRESRRGGGGGEGRKWCVT